MLNSEYIVELIAKERYRLLIQEAVRVRMYRDAKPNRKNIIKWLLGRFGGLLIITGQKIKNWSDSSLEHSFR